MAAIRQTYKIKATHDTYLKKQAIQASELKDDQKVFVPTGQEYQILSREQSSAGHYIVELDYKAGIWYIWSGHWTLPWNETTEKDNQLFKYVDKADLKAIMPYATDANINKYIGGLNTAMERYQITTRNRIAAFLSQIAHESGSLKYNEEIASGQAYEERKDLGNIHPGDGKKFKGRGLIQLTGRANYKAAGKVIGIDLEANPTLATKPDISALIAGWYWDSRNLNALADIGDFKEITRKINGGYNGLADRIQYYERAKKVLGLEAPKPTAWEAINWNDMNANVSKYFTVREVTLGDVRRIPTYTPIKKNIYILALELDKVREEWGAPILVNSWYRPPQINKAVGGVWNSQHLLGLAADVRCLRKSDMSKFQNWLDKKAWKYSLGYGWPNRHFVHLDMRPQKYRWVY